MMVILLIGLLAIGAAGIGLFLGRRHPSASASASASAVAKAKGVAKAVVRRAPAESFNSRHREMVNLFSARLSSGAIGIPDLIRLFRTEGTDPKAVVAALTAALADSPFAGRNDKLQSWLKDGERKA